MAYFWQHDVKDGMEESVSGSRKDQNSRPTINSYMYANAKALANMADLLNDESSKFKYREKENKLKKLVQDSLWDASTLFYKTKLAKGGLAKAREAIGFVPWDFNLPLDQAKYASAWDQLLDTGGFKSTMGVNNSRKT
jgi:neutral trehalase